MPGPRPTPTAVLANRGSWRADERTNEPKPAPAVATVPPELTGRARDLFTRLAPPLSACGILTVADVQGFARYCRLFAAWEKAMSAVEAGGDRSAVLTLSKLDEMLRKLEANYGLTPSDRTGIQVGTPTKTNSKTRFFKE